MAEGKQYQVSLTIDANVDRAKKAMKQLQSDLDKLSTTALTLTPASDIDKDLIQASQAAAQLKVNLESAFNVKTGNLDLVKFNQSMKSAGMSAQKYQEALSSLGPAGDQAFSQLAMAVAKADAPFARVNSKLNEFATSLKNTAKWQISSSILHGLTGSINQAFSYAQQLNSSLNDIRIVTGASADEMAKFATQANQAAKSLSTSTRSYADAALIFYQQGLGDAEVKERTDAVIKMANVTKDSAAQVSSYMTAIWNNFDDGSKSLEHYADVMTALGVATAASTAEIADGLEKFASIGKTIGLSYDYATSALATIVSQTRQSADTVGTGLRTIFSRLQGLSLGETLEDGVNLNKYSKALSAVGVSVLDATGNMKDMDNILDSLASKWDNLTSAQKTALAQTVGGVRQYTTLISLMDNWDSMEMNLTTAKSSSGALQEQANIYAESWDAAKNRVKASAEAIYSSLINDDFFIGLNNGFSGFLDQVNNLIETLGGLKGVLMSLTPIVTALFRNQINSGIRSMVSSLQNFTPGGRAKNEAVRASFVNQAMNMHRNDASIGGAAMADQQRRVAQMQFAYMQGSGRMTEEQRSNAQYLMQQYEGVTARVQKAGDKANEATSKSREMQTKTKAEVAEKGRDYAKRAQGESDAKKKQATEKADIAYQAKVTQANQIFEQEKQRLLEAQRHAPKSRKGTYSDEIRKAKERADAAKEKAEREHEKAVKTAEKSHAVDTKDIQQKQKRAEEARQKYTQQVRTEAFAKEVTGSVMKVDVKADNIDAAKERLQALAAMIKKVAAEQDIDLGSPDEDGSYAQALQKIEEAANDAEASVESLKEAQNGLETASKSGQFGPEVTKSAEDEYSEAMDDLGATADEKHMGEIRAAASEEGTAIAQVAQESAVAEQAASKLNEQLNEMSSVKLDFASGLTASVSAITAVGAAISSVQGLMDLWNDDSASLGDKLISTFTTVATVAGSLGSAFTGTNGQLLTMMGNLILTKFGFTGLTGAMTGTAAASGPAASGLGTVGTVGSAAGFSLQAAFWPILAVMLAIAAAAAVVIGIAAGIKAIADAYNADAIAAEKAAETARNLATAYQEAQAAYSDMVSTMDNYASARAGLDSLTAGTKEYVSALQEANSLGLQLINSTSGLKAGEDYKWENGELIIEQEALDRIKKEEAARVNDAQAASLMADAYATQASNKAAQTKFVRSDNDELTYAEAYSILEQKMGANAASYYASEGGYYSVISTANTYKDSDQQKAVTELTEQYRLMGEEAFSAANLAALGIDSSNTTYVNALREVVEANINGAEKTSAAARLATESLLALDDRYQRFDAEDKTNIGAATSQFYQTEYDASYKDWLSKAQSRNAFNTGNANSKAAWEKYVEVAKLQGKDARVTNYKGRGENATIVYEFMGENGMEEVEISAQEMARRIAAAEANAKVGQSSQFIMDEFSRLDREAEAEGIHKSAVADLLGKNMQQSARNEMLAFQNEYMNGDTSTEATAEQIEAMLDANFGDGADGKISDATAKKYGYKSAKAMVAAMQEEYNRAMKAWDSIELPIGLGEWSDNLSLKAAQQLENVTKNLNLGPLGQTAGDTFVAGLSDMLAGVKTKDQTTALNQLMAIDWSNWDALSQADVILQEFGVDLDLTSTEWINFAESMRLASRSIPDFSKLKSDFTSISKIIGDLDFGEAIGEEDYQTLITYNQEWSKFFVMQADGSRKFIGNAKEMAAATREMALEQRDLLDTYSAAAKNDAITEFDWDQELNTDDKLAAAKADFAELLKPENGGAELTAVMEALGYGNFDWQNATAEQLKAMFDAIYSAVDPTYISQIDDEFQEMYASTATSLSELQEMLTSKTIDGDTYSKSLIAMASGYEYCTAAIKDYQKALARGVGIEEAQANLERAIAAEQEAAKYQSAYSNALSGRDSMSVADLNALEEANPDLYYQYLSASEEEWYEASYQAYMAWLDARIAGYATDSAEYKALMAEKQQLEDEHYEKLEEKALKEKEQQDAIWEKQRSGAESALGTISSNLLSTDSLSFENIAELEATLRQAGIDSERIQTILANLNAGDSADDIKKKVAAAMEVAFAGMATDAEKAKEYNTLMSITDVKIDESVYQKLGDITKVTLAPDGSLISAYLTSLKQDPAKKTITFIGETGEEYTTTYTNCTADGSTRTITFTGTQGETYTTTFTLCTVGADKTITFIGSKGEKYTSTFNECTASGATKTITFKGDDGEYTTKLVSVTQDAANKTITFVGATGETYTSTYNSCVLGADKKITFTGAEGTTYTDLVTSCTAGANKTITLHGENGNYTTKYTEIVGGTPGSKTITLMLEGGAEGQQSALQVEVDKIGLNGKTITYTGDFGQIEEALKSYGLGTGDDGNVTMDVTGESGYTETAEVAGVQLAMGQLTFTTNLGTIQGEVDNLQADLASLPADYPVTVTLKDGSTTTITAKELQQFTTAKGVDMNAVVNYCEGKNADLVDDKEITVTVHYEDDLKEKRAASIRENFTNTLSNAEILEFNSENAWDRVATINEEAAGARQKTGSHQEWTSPFTQKTVNEYAKGMDAWLLQNDSSDRAMLGLQIDALASSNITSQSQIDTLNSLQNFITALATKDPELAAAYQLLLDTAVDANDTITRNAEGQIELVTAATGELEEATTASNEATAAATDSEGGTAGANDGATVVETVADQTVLTGAAEATYTQATIAFQAYDWKQIGTDVVEGITSGINEGLANFNPGDWNPAATATEDAARGAYLTRSPSRLMIPIGHDVVAGVETGIAEGLSDADTGDWTAYALATFAEANGAFKDIGNDGIEGIVKNALLTDLAEYDQDAASIMTIGDDGLYRYNTSTILGQAFASNDENNANLNWYNKYGQFINTEAEDGGWSTFLAWHKQKQTKNAKGEVMTEDEIKAMWDQRFSQMTTIDGHEVMNDYMAEFWKQIADTTITEIEGISGYQRGVMVDVYNRAIEELGEDATGAEITAKMQEIINEEGILLQESAVKAWGQIKDIMINGSVAIVQNEQAAAKEVYEAWVSTFEAISSARLNLMDKTTGSLLSEMQGDSQKLKDIYMKMLTGGVGWDTIFNMMTATGADKSQYMQYFNYTPFDLAHYKQSSNVGYLNWNGDPTNGFMGLNPTTAADFMNNINTLLAPKLTGNTYDFFQEYLTPEKLATMSDAEASVLMQKGIINKTALGYQLVDETTFKGLGSLGNDFFVEMLAQILGMDKSLFTYDSSTGKFSVASGKTDEVNKEVNELTATAMVDTSTANQQRADQITAENKIAIDAKAKELELLEKARDNGVESLDEAEKAQLRSYLGLAENADLSSVSLDTLTGAAADAAAALGLLSKSARTDEYMALKGYTKDAQGNYTLNANTMNAAGYQRYIDPMDPTGKEYYVKFDANGNVIRDSMIAATVTATEAAIIATEYKTGDTTIDDAASGKTETQINADNRLALAQAAGFASSQEQDDYIDYLIEESKQAGITDEADLNREYLEEMANDIMEVEKAWQDLYETQASNIAIMKQGRKGTLEYQKALSSLTKTVKKVFGGAESVTEEFVEEHLEDIEKMADGDEKALERVEDALLSKILGTDYNITVDVDLNDDGLDDKIGDVIDGFNDIELTIDGISQALGDVQEGTLITPQIDTTGATGALIGLLNQGGETAAGIMEALNAIGWTPEVDVETYPVESKGIINGVAHYEYMDSEGNIHTFTGGSEGFNEETMTITVPKIGENGATQYKGLRKTGAGTSTTGDKRGGGGGGGGSRRRHLAKAKPEDHKERYHEINNALDEVTDALERLNKQQDRAWGAERLKSMQAESEELKKQRDLIRKKTEEAQNYLQQDLADAAQYGWTFDEDNNVSNYEDNWDKLLSVYNAKIAEYNAMSAEQQEALEKDVTEANENGKAEYINPDTGVAFGSYEEYLKYHYLDEPTAALEQVEETMDELEQLGIDYDDVLDALYDNFIDQVQTKWDTANEIADANIKYLEHKISRLEDNAYKAAETIGLMSDKMDYTQDKFNAATTALDDLLKGYDSAWSAEAIMAGQLTAEDLAGAGMDANAVEMVQSIMSELMELEQEMTDTLIESFESMTEAFDDFNEDLDRYISTIEHAQSITATYRNIIDLTGKSMSGFSTELLKAFNSATIDQAKANMKSNKTKYDTVQAEYDEAYQQYLNAQTLHAQGKLNDAALKAAKEAFEATQDNLNEAQEAYVASWEAALQAVADAYTSTMEGVMDEIGKNLTNRLAGGLDALQERMDRMKTKDSNYVDDYEKIYQLTKLTRDLETQIDKTSNVRAQKELLKFQKEINGILQSDKKLSEYDIDYLQKKYDLKLAEIALEDAQNAKSQVTMRRDSEGNYNYVYTADENAVADAEAEYATKLYEMQKANDEYITSLSDSIVSLEAEMRDALLALDPTQFASEEEFNAAVEEIIAFYTEQMSYHQEQLETVLGNNKDLYEKDMVWYNKYANYKMADAASFIDSWNETLLAQATGFETMDELFGTFFSQAAVAQSESVTAYRNYVDAINTINAEAGHPTETLAQSLTEDIQTMTDQAEQAATDMEEHAETIVGEITSIGSAIEEMANKFGVEIVNMAKQTDLLVAALTDMLEIMGKAGDIELEEGLLADIEARRQAREQEYASQSFDTGGYTGAWGPEGKLAWLHQKELVLNAADTENILASVGILRQIANTIDLNALTSAGGFISLMSSGISGNKETLQQEVYIEASFPAVTDKNQIEDAFTDLVNLAAQYANRK